MKKILSLILALALVMSMSITAFAAEDSKTDITNNGTANITVSGTYDAKDTTEVINVDIAWGAMKFTYTVGESAWDPDTHTTTAGTAAWSAEGNNITVTNHSNVKISAGLAFNASVDGIVGSFFDAATGGNAVSAITLDAPAEKSEQNASQGTAYLQITAGSISQNESELGKITVTITKAN